MGIDDGSVSVAVASKRRESEGWSVSFLRYVCSCEEWVVSHFM